ncbi:hypothetical protein [Halobacterium zhouii]|uniref:hypothetical protein n=1 Tax=Halobacterium zhouii TaxID=2902624 RepID=UPI001E6195AE|nr:hypothetical protein [Halobacterium zhouii]
MTGYYDLILGLIPVALLGLSGTLFAVGLTLTTAVTAGGLLAVAFVAHGLFVNDPVVPTPETVAESGMDAAQAPAAGFDSAD